MIHQIPLTAAWLAALLMSALLSGNTYAFEKLGHRLICDIAWREIKATTRQSVSDLLRQSSHQTLADGCTWADRIRDRPQYAFLKPQHYINLPRHATVLPRKRSCGDTTCITEAIVYYTAVLRGDPVSDRRYLNTRPQALLMLGHLVGDIHQPLHVSYADDLGGNRVQVSLLGTATNLHRLWDRDLIARQTPNWRSAGAGLFATISARQRVAWADTDIYNWADESLTLTRAIYAELPADGRLDDTYFTRHNPVVIRRIKMAGIRLARLLDSVL
ncbi:S1/P1 nuclease [Exilibacterium tricleocarpae]|uniref:S1/P1 nuclease n=1 Tax=Exilibacterium tricleocarpae TaxID=2591008 RepID=A0A545SY68_9GAMM|nr:S1/P1 nuclease [Exilibacterium tricleocarpae]TQV69908.1 S1/P1 nuclease [Exilibacterium tricleocarpae]